MNKQDRGTKYVCLECQTKFYDLNRTPVACPKCGAKPPVPKPSRGAPRREPGGTRFRRYP